MVNETTVTKLNELRLPSMADSYRKQLDDSSFKDLSFEERFGLMVDTTIRKLWQDNTVIRLQADYGVSIG